MGNQGVQDANIIKIYRDINRICAWVIVFVPIYATESVEISGYSSF